jgi:hypothetical protein
MIVPWTSKQWVQSVFLLSFSGSSCFSLLSRMASTSFSSQTGTLQLKMNNNLAPTSTGGSSVKNTPKYDNLPISG